MFLTGTGFAGACTPFASAALTVCAGFNVAVEPSGKVTVASPLSATDTSVPGFTALTASVTAVFSASVNASVFLTGTLFVGA